MNLQDELQQRFKEITKLDDFTLILEERYDPENYAEYFVKNCILKLYILDSEGKRYPRDIIEREALHELAHHLQYKHTKNYKPTSRTTHGYIFKGQFAKVLKKYYNREVPQRTLIYLREEGYLNE